MIESQVRTARGVFGVRCLGDRDGAIVLGLHGFPDDATTFDGLAEPLAAAGYRVVSLYLRGYSPSPLDGSLGLESLVADLYAVLDALSGTVPVYFLGHDYGAQIGYPAMAGAPHRFAGAVLFAGAHPALVERNARRSLRQLWMSRYIVFFQLGSYAERHVARRDFAYIDRLWRSWSPGYCVPDDRRAHVKRTLGDSMPGPVAMYRGGGFDVPATPIPVPTTFVCGTDDGCARPFLADGQAALFTGPYRQETWPDTGHYPHLEQPQRSADTVLGWFRAHPHPARS